jgi:hypothetical protein
LGYKRLDTVIVSGVGGPLQFRLEPFAVLMEEVSVARKEKSLLEMGEYSEKIGFNPARSATMPRLSHDDLVNMLTMIANKFLDIKDETCENQWFEMMR